MLTARRCDNVEWELLHDHDHSHFFGFVCEGCVRCPPGWR